MFCTNCGVQFEGNFCPACGAPAAGPAPETPPQAGDAHVGEGPGGIDLPAPPLGEHKGNLCSITFLEDRLLLHKKPLLKSIDTEIYYADVASVSFSKGSGLSSGFVCIRTRQDPTPPATAFTAPNDPFSVCFLPAQLHDFLRIHEFLSALAAKNDFSPQQLSPRAASSSLSPGSPVSSPSHNMVNICLNCGDTLLPQAKKCPTCGCKEFALLDKSDAGQIEQLRASAPHPKESLTPNWKAYTPPKPSKKKIIKQRIAENKAQAIACCPKCGSTSLSANRKGFGIGKAVIGASLVGGVGLAAGNIHAKKVIVTCLNCGHQWKP